MFCIECGEKLPDHAKFCFKCGAKVDGAAEGGAPEAKEKKHRAFDMASLEEFAAERRAARRKSGGAAPAAESAPAPAPAPAAPVPAAPVPAKPEPDESEEASYLEKLFAGLDPVVCHSEYYFLRSGNPMLGGFSMAANRGYVLRHVSRYPDDDYILSDENGQNELRLDIRIKLHKAEYKYLMGFNTHGVWFMVRSQINERFLNVKFLCVDVVSGRTIEYPIAHQHGTIEDVYIYEDEVCYINKSVDDVQFLHRLTPTGETQLFETQKDESIFRLSANGARIAWGFISKRDVKVFWRWHFYDRAARKSTQITVMPDKDRPWMPLVEISAVDLAKGTMYTSLTQKEAERFDLQEWSLAVREIKDPVEFGILSYKDKQSAVWKVDRGLRDYYFDGTVFLAVQDPSELDRYDRFGNKYALGRTGSGACQNFLVTDKWLYVNYDARDMVRLPKLFSPNRGHAADNPEAVFVFGKNQNFKM